MRIARFVVCVWLTISVSRLRADDPPVKAPATTPPAMETVRPGDLLEIEFTPKPEAIDVPPDALLQPAPAPQRLHVRIGKDGYARFPLTESTIPFAGLEYPVVAAMLASHLEVHGVHVGHVSARLRQAPMGLVAVSWPGRESMNFLNTRRSRTP